MRTGKSFDQLEHELLKGQSESDASDAFKVLLTLTCYIFPTQSSKGSTPLERFTTSCRRMGGLTRTPCSRVGACSFVVSKPF